MKHDGVFVGGLHFDLPRIDGREEAGKVKNLKLVPHPNGKLQIWEPPVRHEKYVAALDPCNGIPGGDDAAICILSVQRCRQVAEWADNVNPVAAVDMLCALGEYYNYGMINAEINIFGHTILQRMSERRYPNKFRWPKWDELKLSHKYLWETNRHSRPQMFATMLRWFEEKMIAISSKQLLAELSTFQKLIDDDVDSDVHRDRYTFRQQGRRPDNRVIALAIAIQTIKQIPRNMQDHTPFELPATARELGLQGMNAQVNARVMERVTQNAKEAADFIAKYIDPEEDDTMVWNPIRDQVGV